VNFHSFKKIHKIEVESETQQQSVLSTVHLEIASRRNKIGNFNRQDSRLSVKSLIETIENNKAQVQVSFFSYSFLS